MNALPRSWAVSSALLLALGLVGAGCADEKKKNADADAGAEQGPQKPVLGGKLAAAVKAAESAQAGGPARGGADGPPESGVFAPGLGDKAHPAGAPPKMAVLDEGKEPRVLLAPAPGDEQRESVSITVRLQAGAIPGDYALALKVDKPKDEKKTDGPRSYHVAGKIASVSLSSQLPRELTDKLGKLKGTEIRYTLGPDGGIVEPGFTLTKDADPGLGELVVKGIVDAMGVSMPPLPRQPIGAGAYWMVTDRTSVLGVDVVRYRVYRVEKIDKDSASLSIEVRQYAVKDEADLGALGGGQKLSVQRFESTGKGKVEWTPARLLPARGETSQRTGFAGGTGQQQSGLQTDVSVKFAADSDKGDKKK